MFPSVLFSIHQKLEVYEPGAISVHYADIFHCRGGSITPTARGAETNKAPTVFAHGGTKRAHRYRADVMDR